MLVRRDTGFGQAERQNKQGHLHEQQKPQQAANTRKINPKTQHHGSHNKAQGTPHAYATVMAIRRSQMGQGQGFG